LWTSSLRQVHGNLRNEFRWVLKSRVAELSVHCPAKAEEMKAILQGAIKVKAPTQGGDDASSVFRSNLTAMIDVDPKGINNLPVGALERRQTASGSGASATAGQLEPSHYLQDLRLLPLPFASRRRNTTPVQLAGYVPYRRYAVFLHRLDDGGQICRVTTRPGRPDLGAGETDDSARGHHQSRQKSLNRLGASAV
jgi:hypothetical protein